MNNMMEYKGYFGSVEFSKEDFVFYGKVQNIRTLVSYEGKDKSELTMDFRKAVDDYLFLCKFEGKEPERSGENS